MPPGEAFKSAWSRLGQLGEYFRHYLSARIDLLKLSLRNAAIYAALGLVGLIALMALVATLVVMLLGGLAELIAAGLGGRMWAGNLIVSLGMFALIGIGAWLGLKMLRDSHFKQTKAKYELRHQQQREKFGDSAFERSQAPADPHARSKRD